MSVRLMRTFYSRLTADTGGGTNPVRTAVSDRIYQAEAPASSALPLIVFAFTGSTSTNDFDGNSKVTATVDVTIFGKTEAGIDALALIEEKVHTLMNNQDLTVDSNYDRAYVRSVSRGSANLDGEYLRVDSTFTIEGTDTSTAP